METDRSRWLIDPAALDRLGAQSCSFVLEPTSNAFPALPGSCYGPLLPNQNPSPVRAARDRCLGNYNFNANCLLQVYCQKAVSCPVNRLTRPARGASAAAYAGCAPAPSECAQTSCRLYERLRQHAVDELSNARLSLCEDGCAAKVNQMRLRDGRVHTNRSRCSSRRKLSRLGYSVLIREVMAALRRLGQPGLARALLLLAHERDNVVHAPIVDALPPAAGLQKRQRDVRQLRVPHVIRCHALQCSRQCPSCAKLA